MRPGTAGRRTGLLGAGGMDEAAEAMRGSRKRRAGRGRMGLAGALLVVAVAVAVPRSIAQERPDGAATAVLPQEGASGERAPLREFTDGEGRLCRVYARGVMIDGRPQQAFAVVCREANGRWVMSR